MKHIFFTLTALFLIGSAANAQYCGNSGSSVCDTVLLPAPGFSPITENLAPAINGQVSTTIIYFQNYDTLPGNAGFMDSLLVDSITNLPSGLCWSLNIPNNVFHNKQNGCIKLSGTTCSAPGQYRINVWGHLTPKGFPVALAVNLNSYGLKYYVRVNNAGDIPTPVDTTQNGNFVSYNNAVATNCTAMAVNDVDATITSLALYPNPMTTGAEVKFISGKSTEMTQRITNILGGLVSTEIREVRTGINTFKIDRNDMPAGVYFYSLSDGKNAITKRMIINE